MTRKEFKERFLKEKPEGVIIEEANVVCEVIKTNTVINKMLNRHKKSFKNWMTNPDCADYALKTLAIWNNSTNEALSKAQDISEEDAKQILQQTKIAKELVARGHKVKMEIVTTAKYAGNLPEPHHWNIYAIFKCSVEALACFYRGPYKQKLFVFTEDGVFRIKTPPPLLNTKRSAFYTWNGDYSENGIFIKVPGEIYYQEKV